MTTNLTVEEEVAWGEGREGAVVGRWLDLSSWGGRVARVIKSSDYDDFDFYVFKMNGLPLVWLEVKVRTIPFETYEDAMFPLRKHQYAVEMWHTHRIPVVAVTEYACGSLWEIKLHETPSRTANVKRTGRNGEPVPHVFYKKSQMLCLDDGN